MNKLIKTSLIVLALAFNFNPLNASGNHDGHSHSHDKKEVTKAAANKEATKKINKLIKANKIEKSWTKASLINVKKKKFGHDMEWVFSFKNDKVKNTKKQVIYVFVDLYGEVTGANYTGK